MSEVEPGHQKPPVYESKDVNESPHSDVESAEGKIAPLHRNLHNRHMQMIAIGGAIGAGLFVNTGAALRAGGPGSLLICYLIVGFMLLQTMWALGELAVMYPVNGAYFDYSLRFLDPSWGFAMGWDYAINWLVILPFEITAAGLTIRYWRDDLNIGIWIAVFLTVLSVIQVFGVRGYGEVEFILSIIKVTALTGFIILGIVIDCGGAPVGGYIGGKYWHNPGAFTDFVGFCSVFTTAAFAFGGTEMSGLAAAESANPAKSIPKACKQVFWRIMLFYVIGTLIVGLIVPHDADYLLNASGAGNTSYSPFVVSIKNAGISGLPSVMNVVITLSVISVANSATFGSTRTIQAMAEKGMAPKFFAYIDKHGRPIYCVLLQIAFGFLAFINEASSGSQIFTWLLALSGISNFFVWGSVCLAHIRFRAAWKYNGRSTDELAYVAPWGVYGSYIGLGLNILCLIAEFYVSVQPLDVQAFFENYLAAPIVIALYAFWRIYSAWTKDPTVEKRGWKLWRSVDEIDVFTGIRDTALDVDLAPRVKYDTWGEWVKALPMRLLRSIA
ncbi:amino acid transporter, putative [Talaromyces stipitatus ATCC 10500]|uniref:Amino acid transporter, putative n=1 Tax=Talaromyces stipitatus (strain ATCC 10500 / CBS 375.48 / QM 6759 / NRRL 1006) TaxID=441959 RepID=B8MHZ6_TALSN|nr:amino acid transporter, putative [Talaromyces stipitatus ATCC 10500]EED17158.1 amino acid transporter, putative [Talaromyces stipitatus ATCC 10500]